MDIPDLPPDISFVQLPRTAEAIGFAFEPTLFERLHDFHLYAA
jgi:hypothetical protein